MREQDSLGQTLRLQRSRVEQPFFEHSRGPDKRVVIYMRLYPTCQMARHLLGNLVGTAPNPNRRAVPAQGCSGSSAEMTFPFGLNQRSQRTRNSIIKINPPMKPISIANSLIKAALFLPVVLVSLACIDVAAQVVSPVEPAKIEGHTYAEWSESFWQWTFSLPLDRNPAYNDQVDPSTGQHGKVWYLASPANDNGLIRTVTVPKGTLLFFPMETEVYDNTDCDGMQRISDGASVADLRSLVQAYIDVVHDVRMEIDGFSVPGLSDAANSDYRVQTPSPKGFSYMIPGMNSVLSSPQGEGGEGLTCWTSPHGEPIHVDGNIYHAVADGIYIMVGPLAPGTHTIHAHSEGFFTPPNGDPFVSDVIFQITVRQ